MRDDHGVSAQRIGREKEFQQIQICLELGKNLLLEGPVGVGKTFLAAQSAAVLRKEVIRIDGDGRFTEQKLSGWFDPQTVLKKGYVKEAFMKGPLLQAMETGGVFLINELNRLPEGVQNILLSALDEGVVFVPQYGLVQAKDGFGVIATQNPKEFVGATQLSEAILDRFELIRLDYQSETEELQIVHNALKEQKSMKIDEVTGLAVKLARLTREDSRVHRGASIRASLAVAALLSAFLKRGTSLDEAFLQSALMALPTRIEFDPSEGEFDAIQASEVIQDWVNEVLKKKT
jgi:MoxR-like ATPase